MFYCVIAAFFEWARNFNCNNSNFDNEITKMHEV
ncbi:Uncharacterised protein [Citrobacter werkmanii]|nr:Uncharacterised protein [Citrobacter werkmanii]